MSQQRVTNALLFVIAACLVLIVIHLYRFELIQPAEAQQRTITNSVELVYRNADGHVYPMADGQGRIYTVNRAQ